MTPRHWDHAKLNALLEKMHARVRLGLREESDAEVEDSVAEVVGYWMYELLACQDGPLPAPVASRGKRG